MLASKLILILSDHVAKYGDRTCKVYDGDGAFVPVACVAVPDTLSVSRGVGPEDPDVRDAFLICDKDTMEAFT